MIMLWIKSFFGLLKELYFDKNEDLNITSKGFKLKRWVGMLISASFILLSCYFFIQLVEVGKELEIMQQRLNEIILLEYEREELLLKIKYLEYSADNQKPLTPP